MGRVDLEAGLGAIATLRGLEGALIVERTREFFEDEVAPAIRREAIEMVERHRADGHHVVTLTSHRITWPNSWVNMYLSWAHRNAIRGGDGILAVSPSEPFALVLVK